MPLAKSRTDANRRLLFYRVDSAASRVAPVGFQLCGRLVLNGPYVCQAVPWEEHGPLRPLMDQPEAAAAFWSGSPPANDFMTATLDMFDVGRRSIVQREDHRPAVGRSPLPQAAVIGQLKGVIGCFDPDKLVRRAGVRLHMGVGHVIGDAVHDQSHMLPVIGT